MSTKNKIVICFFGVCSRAIKYTHHNHLKNIIDIIKTDYDYDIYVFNNNVGDTLIDGIKQSNDDVNIILKKADIFEEMNQIDIDEKINEKILRDNINIKMREDYTEYGIRNAIRQMFSEEQVGLFLEKNINNYKSAIVCNSDLYFLNKINLENIRESITINSNSSVYTSTLNEQPGSYTNAFYFGSLEPLSKILKRFSILEKLLPTHSDYEHLLKKGFDMHGITRIITDIDFVKIRSNKYIFMMPGRTNKNSDSSIINEIQNDINSIV